MKLLSFYARAFYASWVGSRGEKRSGTRGRDRCMGELASVYEGGGVARRRGTGGEAAAQKTRKKHEPGHMPVATPAMLEGYASTRPPRTEQ